MCIILEDTSYIAKMKYATLDVHFLSQLCFRLDNSSIDISMKHAIRAVQIPIKRKINHLAKFFLTTNLYPFFLSSSCRR